MVSLAPVSHPVLCLTHSSDNLIETHFEDPSAPRDFYVLELDGPAPVQIGVHDGEPWYRWVWMWQDTREADQALDKVPLEVESCLDSAIATIRQFVTRCSAAPPNSHAVQRLDMAALLAPIGWPMRAVPASKARAAQGLVMYRRLLKDRGSPSGR